MSATNEVRLAVLEGDGIGPEITSAAVEVLKAAAARAGANLSMKTAPIGWKAYNETGSTLPEKTLEILQEHPGWILGPTFAGEYPEDDPIRGHPSGYLRSGFKLFANVRPVKSWPQLDPIVSNLDITIIRENTQGFYPDRNLHWGYGEFLPSEDVALSLRVITRAACERFAQFSLGYAAALGHGRLAVVHKRTALPRTEELFIGEFERQRKDFGNMEIDLLRIDTFSSTLPVEPDRFHIVATTNLFGDIISDQAAGLAGGVGLAPSLNAGTDHAMAQAVHGTAADIAGKGIANPTALILSTALLLRCFDQKWNHAECGKAASLIEDGVDKAFASGVATSDLNGSASTSDFAKAVIKAMEGGSS